MGVEKKEKNIAVRKKEQRGKEVVGTEGVWKKEKQAK